MLLGSPHCEPVGALQLHLEPELAGIYHLATVPQARRRGVGTETTFTALCEGRALQLRKAVLQPARAGIGICSRLGITEHSTCRR